MMKQKLMAPEGLRGYRVDDSGYKNAINLMVTNQWEDALACLVLDAEPEKVLGWALGVVNTLPLNDDARLCMASIRQWLDTHDDVLRREIYQQAETTGFDTPIGSLGLALFWMQGSMTPKEFDAVYPEPHLCPLMLHCALKLLSVQLAANNAPAIGAQNLLMQWRNMHGGC